MPVKNKPYLVSRKEEKMRIVHILLALSLILILSFLVFVNSLNSKFIASWDDNAYVIENIAIKGLSAQNIKTIFTSFYVGHYQPISILSYSIDYSLFGLNPKGFHITNLIFHLLNIILVFFLIYKLSYRIEAAFISAILFAIHPMHVESVVWIAERKDVMYAFFYLGSLISYINYITKNKTKYLIYTAILFIFSLLSKSAAVTLPVLLFLFDFFLKRKYSIKLILEKIPLIVLSIFFGLLAIYSQKSSGALTDFEGIYTLTDHIFIIIYSIAFYIFMLILPIHQSIIHYYPEKINGYLPIEYYLSVLLILLVILIIIKSKKNRKYFIFGFLFFLISISLVIKIIPLGIEITSERNTYIPYIGLFFIISHFSINIIDNKYKYLVKLKPFLAILFIIYLGLFSIKSWQRTKVWKDSYTLFSDVIDKYPNHHQAYYNRGIENLRNNDFKAAISDFDKVIEINPNFIDAYLNRGNLFAQSNNFQAALIDFNKIIELDSNHCIAYQNRGILYFKMNKTKEACSDWNKAYELGNTEVLSNIYKYCK
ncbi:MAG: tetratricopeptide repeat protein [Saprospiraceae bacterium]|nr:tetratricopeptide repeat protein [Saprospiraceae bacterium]